MLCQNPKTTAKSTMCELDSLAVGTAFEGTNQAALAQAHAHAVYQSAAFFEVKFHFDVTPPAADWALAKVPIAKLSGC